MDNGKLRWEGRCELTNLAAHELAVVDSVRLRVLPGVLDGREAKVRSVNLPKDATRTPKERKSTQIRSSKTTASSHDSKKYVQRIHSYIGRVPDNRAASLSAALRRQDSPLLTIHTTENPCLRT